MNYRLFLLPILFLFFYSCSTTETVSRSEDQPAATDTLTKVPEPVNFDTMLEPPEEWHHYDEQETLFRGISSERAYEIILRDRSPKEEIVVAVIDGGVDTEHEDLEDVIWTNEDEIPGNGKDDDGNGYVDDVHGWNFIGGDDGENINHDTFELTRLYAPLHERFSDADTTELSEEELEEYKYYRELRSDYEYEINQLDQQYNNIESLEQSMQQAEQILDDHFSGSDYTYEDISELEPTSQELNFAKNVMSYVLENDIDSTMIADQKKQIYEFAKYGYNPDFDPRNIVGDDYENKNERHYGNNDVAGPDPSHGTHVAGIIAADRTNEIGIKGIAENTHIMAIRAVPNGDERDKDVANAIRYAVDNGADVINMSFGKSYSPHKEVVDEAIQYADANNVLMIHGSGNSAENTDNKPSYPTDKYENGNHADLWLTVGATSWKPNEEFVAQFSNYGDETVDLFAPGVDIYSTMPDNEYKFQEGTSMASPVVAGTAALIMAYYPELSAQQVREVILDNTVKYSNQEVTLPNEGNSEESETVNFSELSVSDGVVNVYRALQAAEKISQ